MTTPAVLAPGFHVNLIHPDPPEDLDQYLVIVNHPRHVFAGGATQVPDTAILEAMIE